MSCAHSCEQFFQKLKKNYELPSWRITPATKLKLKKMKMKTRKGIKPLTLLTAISLVFALASCKKDTYISQEGLCPVVISTNPTNGATKVPLAQVIEVFFNTKIDPTTLTDASFILTGGTRIAGTISYNSTNFKMTFKPDSVLAYSTGYTGRVTTLVKEIEGNALQEDYVWTFTTGAIADTLPPVIISTDPVDQATSVVLNKAVIATFDVPMDPASFTGSSFFVMQGTNIIAGSINYNNNSVGFVPTIAFTQNTTYTVTVTNSVKSSMGISMVNNYVWIFTTGVNIAPTIIMTDPLNNATGVQVNKLITATFSEGMNPLTINGTTFFLKQGLNTIGATVTYAGNTASLNPSANLLPGTTYTATIKVGAQNLSGVPIANDYVWKFTTATATTVPTVPMVISTDPSNNAPNVPLNKTISATFNQAMNPGTLNGITVLLTQGTNTINCVISYIGNTVSFDPSSNLLAGTNYVATIKAGAQNVGGTPMASDYTWNFTTLATTTVTPFVDLKSVARFGIIAGVGVSNNAGFSEIHDMDVGISPGVRSSITGFPPAVVINGAIYASDDIAPPGIAAMLTQAKADLTAAYLFAEGATSPAPATVSGDLGGQTLAPGIYKSTSTLMVQSGNLTLDAGGNPNAFWVFQVASAFTTVGGAGGSIILTGGAKAENIFWQTGSSATIGDNTAFHGTILALTSITMNSNATAVGRMLCRNGSVVLTSTNIINKP